MLGGGVEAIGRVVQGKSAASAAVTGWSSPQPEVSSPASRPWSTKGERRRTAWASRRSQQRSTRTPAASSAGYHRVVSSHTQRTGSRSRSRTNAGRSPETAG
ncbi:hypothetical protein [Blastococcus brunescens]|uniref:Uncharacterized protein n=1 Tax=Blastococcus brunescens TaxID=1564165 RepID=A0ABZ1B710_9ACTN|nr:hypothetical protein [Blastococcus sp. BMG 8361]WRL66598.1 hypothetical protein U6N30_15065 [Blastococcus sp. BMG 8361]